MGGNAFAERAAALPRRRVRRREAAEDAEEVSRMDAVSPPTVRCASTHPEERAVIPRRMTLLAAAATCAALSSPAAATHPLPNQVIEVALNGQNVLDAAGNRGGGDPDGSGVARLEWDHASLVWQLTYQNLG